MKMRTEHAGGKNGGGHRGKRAEAKELSNKARRATERIAAAPETSDATYERIRKEAASIIAGMVRLRHAEQEKRDAALSGRSIGQQADYMFKLMVFDGDAPMPRPRGEPDPADTVEEAYRAGLRFWARRCAELMTFEQWQDMTYDLAERFKGEPIDPISFLEGLFDGLETQDGSLIVS